MAEAGCRWLPAGGTLADLILRLNWRGKHVLRTVLAVGGVAADGLKAIERLGHVGGGVSVPGSGARIVVGLVQGSLAGQGVDDVLVERNPFAAGQRVELGMQHVGQSNR